MLLSVVQCFRPSQNSFCDNLILKIIRLQAATTALVTQIEGRLLPTPYMVQRIADMPIIEKVPRDRSLVRLLRIVL